MSVYPTPITFWWGAPDDYRVCPRGNLIVAGNNAVNPKSSAVRNILNSLSFYVVRIISFLILKRLGNIAVPSRIPNWVPCWVARTKWRYLFFFFLRSSFLKKVRVRNAKHCNLSWIRLIKSPQRFARGCRKILKLRGKNVESKKILLALFLIRRVYLHVCRGAGQRERRLLPRAPPPFISKTLCCRPY